MLETMRDPTTTPSAAEIDRARSRLVAALRNEARLRNRYEASIGTSVELDAYVALRAAVGHVGACDRWLKWTAWDGDAAEPGPVISEVERRLLDRSAAPPALRP